MTTIKISYQTALTMILFAVFYFISQAASAASSDIAGKKFISYTDVGAGKPLVLIHAFPTDQRLWEPQREGLKKHFRVITLDLWGFGKSSPVNGQAVSMNDYANEVKQLLDQLHIQKAIIGGESMGGYIALAFLEKYPNSINGLILSDTQSIADNKEGMVKREATSQEVLAHGNTQLINGFMPKALTPKASKEMQNFLRNILESQSSTGIASALRGMALRDDKSNLLSVTPLPILIITGDQDTLILPAQSQNMHQLSKNNKLVVIANAAHLSSLEQPKQWNQAIIGMFYLSSK